MEWVNEFLDWLSSAWGQAVVSGVAFSLIAIVIAALLAAAIARAGIRRLIAQRDRDAREAVVVALVDSAYAASRWHSDGPLAREHAERLANEADVRLRMLPLGGAALAAEWARREIGELRRHSVSYSYPSDHAVIELRDRLVEWVRHPRRAKKLFAEDLERRSYEPITEDDSLLDEQQSWLQDRTDAETAVLTPATPGTIAER